MLSKPDFNTLYREHYSRVYGLCRRLLNSPALAEDATQESFMKAWNSLKHYDAAQPFWQWIATIANNHCIDVLRKQTREKKVFDLNVTDEDEAYTVATEEPQTLDLMIDEQEVSLLNTAIERLPEKYRVPLVMAYYKDASYDEIATTLDITITHVGVLLLRARKQLRTLVEEMTSADAGTERLP